MRKLICTVMVIAFLVNVSAQLKVDTIGRVGIGTVNPQYKLDIAGSTHIAGGIYLGNDSNFIATTGSSPLKFKVDGVLVGYTGNMYATNLNVSFGYRALSDITTGSFNTGYGIRALSSNTSGSYNTAIGFSALYTSTKCYRNTAIGHNAGSHTTNLDNATAIGFGASATSSNQVRIGDYNVTSIGGYAAWSNLSDKRAKKNIRSDVPGLAFINQLQPITYNLNLDAIDGLLKIDKTKQYGENELSSKLTELNKKAREVKEKKIQTGFIAQDVDAIAKSIGYDFSGVDVDETGIYGLRYAEFVVPLVKAVQELSAQNDRLQAQVNELAGVVSSLLGKDVVPVLLKSGSVSESATGLQELTANGASLQQNTPNPFNVRTEIRYSLTGRETSAMIYIFNMQGSLIKKHLTDGSGILSIEASELTPGMYIYTLVADGKEVDTKRMILTN